MSLSAKILVLLSAVVALYALTDHTLQRLTISRSFDRLEELEARRDLGRVIAAIDEEGEQLDQVCLSRSAWDETWAFVSNVQDREQPPSVAAERRREAWRYERSNLVPESLQKDSIDLLYVCDPDGRVLWGGIFEPQSRAPISLRDFPRESLGAAHPLLAREALDGGRPDEDPERRSGLMLTERGPMLVSARPILNSRREGPPRGTLVIGRFLGSDLVAVLSRRTKISFQLWPLDGSELSGVLSEAVNEATASEDAVVRRPDASFLHVYKTVPDITRAPGLLVRANVERSISTMGAASLEYAWVSTLIAGLLMLLVLLVLIDRAVLNPIGRLTRNALAVGENESARVRFDLERSDEIGVLSREFDNMLEKLARSQEALVLTARRAGMSEIATGILHNVGNVLNSVNVSASMVVRRAKKLCVDDFQRLDEVLTENAGDLARFVTEDPRGRALQPYVSALAGSLRDARHEIDAELDSLLEGIGHIRSLIQSQQSYAGRSGLLEPVAIPERLDEAFGITDKALAPDAGLELVREYEELPELLADKHKLLEILVNLIQNARQALAEGGRSQRRLTLRARAAEGGRVRIEVEDDGCGFAPEQRLEIFQLGFSTKPGGHGVGLHSAANAAKEMGGALVAHSAGPGRGATFALELPLPRTARAEERPCETTREEPIAASS